MPFIHVPTYYAVYIVVDKETGILRFVRACKTKGEAVEWIYKSGDKEIIYCIQEHLKRK